MAEIPDGMLPETFDYVRAFTIAHEGDTPFMYNNWPLKNPQSDVTAGVGLAIANEEQAASAEIRNMFRVKATGEVPSEEEMRAEFRRVFNLPRTPTNLFSDYRDRSPLIMDRDAMLDMLQSKMLGFWEQKGQDFPDFGSMPAQAQVALMSYNYGARLRIAPKMCEAVRNHDYADAAEESKIAGWDAQKNQAHKVLFLNAQKIFADNLDPNILPPIDGPFKPPPSL
jgi:hypothetical protein